MEVDNIEELEVGDKITAKVGGTLRGGNIIKILEEAGEIVGEFPNPGKRIYQLKTDEFVKTANYISHKKQLREPKL